MLRASVDEAEHLLTNAWIVSLYRIGYLRFTSGQEVLREADFAWYYKRVLALYSLLLTAEGPALFQAALQTDVQAAWQNVKY